MPLAVRIYVGAVIAAGALIAGFAAASWNCEQPVAFAVLLGLALATSFVKLRLPGIDGSYSLNFLFILIGVSHFSLPETLLVGCSAALTESLFLMEKRPTAVQIAFNLANVAISVGACFAVAYGPLAATLRSQPSMALALTAAVFFLVNTVLVSGVLALLSKQSLQQTCSEWYVWAFPYYLAGAVLVGAVPLDGGAVRSGFWLALVPALYLIHFFWALSKGLGNHLDKVEASPSEGTPAAAKVFAGGVVTLGGALLIWSAASWAGAEPGRFGLYLLAAVLASVVKIPVPHLTGTISLNFVVLLAACTQLSLAEVLALSVVSATVQSWFKPEVRPTKLQALFNAAALILAGAAAYAVAGGGIAGDGELALYARLEIAALAMYAVNTMLVSTVCCLVAQRPLRQIWEGFCFWTMPYYLLGAAFAGLIGYAAEGGTAALLLALPLLALIGVSYRIHLRRAEQAVS